jgi:toxin ParE1/3/4
LASSPQSGRLRPDFALGLRTYRIGNYFIFYFPTETGIEVARVLHGARNLPTLF